MHRYQTPTAIQAQGLPAALSGRDVLVRMPLPVIPQQQHCLGGGRCRCTLTIESAASPCQPFEYGVPAHCTAEAPSVSHQGG